MQAANTLYVVSVVAASIAARRGSLVSVENPSNSHFWALADRIAGELGLDGEWGSLQATKFHSCMWGASRPKLTTFRPGHDGGLISRGWHASCRKKNSVSMRS